VKVPYAAMIGLGASALSLQGVIRFFEHSAQLTNICFVLVMQHREALDDVAFKSQLTALTSLRCKDPETGEQPAPGWIYIAAANVKLSMAQGAFVTVQAEQPPGARATIDTFLVSMAQELGEQAVGVTFAGTGSDGTLGVTALRENGCFAVAERLPGVAAAGEGLTGGAGPNTARDAASLADVVLPAEAIPARIVEHLKLVNRTRAADDFDALVHDSDGRLARIATVLRNQTGHDFHGYKRNTFMRRVQRRMQVVQTATIDEYLEHLRASPEEAQALFNDLLIGVTHFFRDHREFDFLESRIIPKLFEGKTSSDQLRIWVLGCATGEEAYSLCILLREYMATLDSVPQVQIFATDIDGRALALARVGRYGVGAIREMTPARLARWFLKEGETYYVVRELREMCIFSQHSIIKDAPFSRLDLISCRNLLIYLSAELQNRVIPLFHFALRPGGYLFLGSSENVTRHSKLFTAVDRKFRIFRQQEPLVRRLPDFPLAATSDHRPRREQSVRVAGPSASLSKQAERIMERYSPAYMILDENYDVLHFFGRTGPYIDPPAGVASLNVLNLVHRELRISLRAALQKVAVDGNPVRTAGFNVTRGGRSEIVTMSVERMEIANEHLRRFVVILQEGYAISDPDQARPVDAAGASSEQHANLERLESELQLTRDRLQATVEELESTNEELRASNEEYQSVNEEVQSANEELETSKEELQSLNEELHTVNGELSHRVDELGRTNSDLKNLFESTQIATVFLDGDLRIKSFTPAITELFHLIDSDLGRPIGHIAARVAYEDLEEDVRKVLRTLSTIERETRNTRTGSRYLTRVLPYRSIDNVIEGVVLTFLDITLLSRAEERLRESESRLRVLVEGMPQLVWRANPGGVWTWSSPQWTSFTGQPPDAALGMGWLQAIHPDDRPAVKAAWSDAASHGTLSVDHRLWSAIQGGYLAVHTRAAPLRSHADADTIVEWLGTSTDVHELLQLQQRQKILLAELQHRVRNSLSVVRSLVGRSAATSGSVHEYAGNLKGRVDALARAQSILSRAPEAVVDLKELIVSELTAQGVNGIGQLTIEGPGIVVSGKAAEDLSLSFHELTTNSIKYGALKADGSGSLAVTWSISDDSERSELLIRWQERPVDPVAAPSRRGLGSELIEKLIPYELQGTGRLEFYEDHVLCTLQLPLSESIRLVRSGPEKIRDFG
jgi:two-component system CheB/CheR fusion protein